MHSFIHTFIHSCIHSCIHSFIHSFSPSFIQHESDVGWAYLVAIEKDVVADRLQTCSMGLKLGGERGRGVEGLEVLEELQKWALGTDSLCVYPGRRTNKKKINRHWRLMMTWISKQTWCYILVQSVERQKGVNVVQRCSVENQKGAITVQSLCDSALLVLNGTSLSSINALLALSWYHWLFSQRFRLKVRQSINLWLHHQI